MKRGRRLGGVEVGLVVTVLVGRRGPKLWHYPIDIANQA